MLPLGDIHQAHAPLSKDKLSPSASNIPPCIPLVAWEGQCCLVYQTRNCQSGNLEFSTTFPENLSKSLNLSVSEYPHVESEGKQDPPERGMIRTNQKMLYQVWVSIVIRNVCYYVITFQLMSWWFLTDKNWTFKLGLYPLEKWLSVLGLQILGKEQENIWSSQRISSWTKYKLQIE